MMKKAIVYLLTSLLVLHSYAEAKSNGSSGVSQVGTQLASEALKNKPAAEAQQAAGKAVVGEEGANKISNFFDSPPGILLVSGIATVMSGMLYKAAAKQEEEADANIKKIERIMAEFKDSYVNSCPNGRNDLSSPECYCYTDKGAENPERTKSQICQELWKKNKMKITALAGDYSATGEKIDPVGCVTLKGQFDEDCKCKKFIDGKGNNACMKSVSITLPSGIGSAIATDTGLKAVTQLAANSANGNPMFNNFNANDLNKKALSTNKLKEQLMSKYGPEIKDPNFKKLPDVNEGNVLKVAHSLFGEKNIQAAMSSSGQSALDVLGSSEIKHNDLLKSAASKAGIEMVGGRGIQGKKAENKEAFKLELGSNESSSTVPAFEGQSEQAKNYKIKGDISSQSQSSIFEIISNRYINSGLKRLFDDEPAK